VGISVRPWGTATSEGSGLWAHLSATRAEGGSTSYGLGLYPQYRFAPDWLAMLWLDLSQSENFRDRTVSGTLVWKVTGDLSLLPSVSWMRSKPRDGSSPSSQDQYSAGLSAYYHLSRELSLFGSVDAVRGADVDFGYSKSVDRRGYSGMFGARWAF
jgi:hypothetical protein